MGILDAPGLRPGDSAPWSVVSSRPVKSGDAATAATMVPVTTRLSEVAPYDLAAVRLVYANWQNVQGPEGPNYNPYRVKAAIHKGGTSAPDRALTDQVSFVNFGGREYGYVRPGGLVLSDPVYLGIKKGERWFHESYADIFLPPAPAAPALTLAAGSGQAVGAAYVCLTYVYADGTESLPSAETSITTTSGNTSIVVTSPTAQGGAVGWRAYIAQPTSSAGAIKYEDPAKPMAPIGTNITFSSSFVPTALHRMIRTAGNAGLPLGRGLLLGQGQVDLGENNIGGRDYTDAAVTITGQGSYGGQFSPIGVLGVAADGKLHRSVALLGDSIQAGTGDSGYGGALGGFGFRACANQTTQLGHDPTKTPSVGFFTVAQGGELLSGFLPATGGARRRQVAEYATTIIDNYGTNDLGAGSAVIYAMLLTQIATYAGRKKYFHSTFTPKTSSSDGYRTVANQTVPSTDFEADRRALNNCFRSSASGGTITGEALFRSPVAGTATPATTLTAGDGTAVKFYPAFPFRTGTETVKVGGVTKAVTTDYTYRQTASIGGVTYASGIQFVTAPGNGVTVTMDYTRIAGFGSVTGFTGYFDVATPLEVNAAGALTANGGWWVPAVTAGGITGTPTALGAASLTDSGKAWTVDQWRGWSVIITADPTTPAAVGQVLGIQSNTATVLTLSGGWSPTPSTSATYQILQPYTIDGTHPTSTGHLAMSQQVDASKF